MGLMKCPNCEVIEEDGLWMKVANSEDGESSDEDEDEECNDDDQYNEQHDMNPLHTTNDAQNGGASHMSFTWHEMNIYNVPQDGATPNIHHRTFQTNNGRNIFSYTFVDGNPILQQNERRQQLDVPPRPIALEMIDRRIFVSSLNVVPDPVSHESPTLYEQTRRNVLPCLELTLATTSSSVYDGRPPPPCQCISCRASPSKMH
ncbi:hypothetical protein KY290_025679 [Solanum tuberosum]|uniref:Uncharacterized protein n=1 Tax=Solanum tuberosum TaxID=4113 RepID=A0ABQ7UVY9_SOLTU|nr:hypothetical protein KY290_025679 [Solanum tuberosum]